MENVLSTSFRERNIFHIVPWFYFFSFIFFFLLLSAAAASVIVVYVLFLFYFLFLAAVLWQADLISENNEILSIFIRQMSKHG